MQSPSIHAEASANAGFDTLSTGAVVHTTGSAANPAQTQLQWLAAALEMQTALDDIDTLDQAAQTASGQLSRLLNDARVRIVWRIRQTSAMEVIGDSDRNADATGANVTNADTALTLLQAAADEIAARAAVTRWPVTRPADRVALLAVKQWTQAERIASLIAVPMMDSQQQVVGVLIVVDPPPTATAPLQALAEVLTAKLIQIRRRQPGRLASRVAELADHLRAVNRRLLIGSVVAITVVMMIPMPYRVTGDLELQPMQRRFVAVGFDGPLESARVRPGDVVQQGEILATINPREIEYELAGVQAELHQANQQKNGKLAEHDFAGSQIAGLESERLRLQSELLKYQRDNLEIRSPLAGVVVSGDWKESEGMPMSRGDTLFEIAPLGEMIVEIAIAEDDFAHVQRDMPVQFYVHALPQRSMSGRITRIHPRAELRDGENVFIAEVHVSDSDHLLRPGMRGRAKIRSDRHPLAWNLFHKAADGLQRMLGW